MLDLSIKINFSSNMRYLLGLKTKTLKTLGITAVITTVNRMKSLVIILDRFASFRVFILVRTFLFIYSVMFDFSFEAATDPYMRFIHLKGASISPHLHLKNFTFERIFARNLANNTQNRHFWARNSPIATGIRSQFPSKVISRLKEVIFSRYCMNTCLLSWKK